LTAILDGPVAAVNGEDTLGIGLLRRSTGDAVGDFRRDFAALFVYAPIFARRMGLAVLAVRLVISLENLMISTTFGAPESLGFILYDGYSDLLSQVKKHPALAIRINERNRDVRK